MKTLQYIIFIYLLSLGTSNANYNQEVRPPSQDKAFYFTLDIKKYEIRPNDLAAPQNVRIRLYVPNNEINLMYDRPSIQIEKTSISYLIDYLSRPGKKDLNLSLMVYNHENQETHPLDFKVIKADFSLKTRVLEFVAELHRSPGFITWWKKFIQKQTLNGFETVLFLGG